MTTWQEGRVGDRCFATSCHSPLVGTGEEARCRFVIYRGLELTGVVFPDESLRSFARARVEVNGRCPDHVVRDFKVSSVVSVTNDVGATSVKFFLMPGDVLDVSSTNSSGAPAKLACSLLGFSKEVS
jgi:hypothetical protein